LFFFCFLLFLIKTITKQNFTKKKKKKKKKKAFNRGWLTVQRFSPLSSRGKHGGMQADMLLEKEQRPIYRQQEKRRMLGLA
jgi:hypothetical protein